MAEAREWRGAARGARAPWILAVAVAAALAAAPAPAQEPDSAVAAPLPAPSDTAAAELAPRVDDERIDPRDAAARAGVLASIDSVRIGRGVPPEGRRALERILAAEPAVVQGDLTVPRDSTFPNGLLVVDGTLRFAGRTSGDLVVVGGDVFLRPGADVAGDVTVIGGGYYGSGLGRVAGQRTAIRGARVRVVRDAGAVEVTAEPEDAPFPVALRGLYGFSPEGYNRVDGLAVRWGVRYVPPVETRDSWRLTAQALLRTSRDDVGWLAAAAREIAARRLTLRASWYNVTDTGERWHRSDVESSLATLFLGEDNRFYFDRQGIELRAVQELRGPAAVDLAFRNDEYRSVEAQDPFTIASDDFLPNPAVPPGRMRSVLGGATWDGRDDPDDTTRGWWARVEGEAAGGVLEGDYGFTTGRVDVRRWQPIGAHRIDARLVVGGRVGGFLPQQKRFHLGGAATLPGYEALSVAGDRAALLNLRYRIPVPALRLGPWRDAAWVTLLGDLGDAWESRGGDPDWLASGGVGVAGRGALDEVGVYVVVPSEEIAPDQSKVSVFLYFGRFF